MPSRDELKGDLLTTADALYDAGVSDGKAQQADADATVIQGLRADVAAAQQHAAELQAAFDAYKASHPDPEPQPAKKIIGMSAPDSDWKTRLAEVGPTGIRARRLFVSPIDKSGTQKLAQLQECAAAGIIPVISYKVADPTNPTAYVPHFTAAAKTLDGLGIPVVATIHHEPNPDMTGAQYVALHRTLAPILKRGQVKVGCLLNGWLVDNTKNTALLDTYLADDLLALWDYVGMDTYQAGSMDSPKTPLPGDRVAGFLKLLDKHGAAGKPLVIGEYNGFTADALAKSGETFLSTPSLWIALLWNNTGGKGVILSGDRLAAFKATKADARVQQ